jgi:arginine/lysine/ornithine decarboxylase
MVTAENKESDFARLLQWGEHSRLVHHKKKPLQERKITEQIPERVMTIREAVFAKNEFVPAREAAGRICAAETVSCPPAIPIAVSGERITKEMADAFLRFDIEKVCVVKE